ncbi:CAAX farnesyltransferase (FTase) subunit beta [Tulasnella sp. 403]|nr:CAAX farnesyltransferase (FTase) subunit beta [Tulasnella sp. 403]
MTLKRNPQPTDGYETETTFAQADTERTIVDLFRAIQESKKPITFNRNTHLNWLVRLLIQGFPARYTSQDASQAWLLYFVLQSFQMLGVAFDPDTKQKAIKTILGKQHAKGGFGGGPGQAPHLLATYPSVCALAIVGSPGPDGGWDQIDRQGMYNLFMSLKQPDGSFIVCHGGEVDVRGTYCLLVVATLLDLITPALIHNTFDFLRSCQTYEGGFSSSSQPYFSPDKTLLADPRPCLGEAHGGYTSCAVASLLLLRPVISASSFPGVDVQALLRWAAMMQGSEYDEGGGFRGRTNKLVDGCYSWWVGGLFSLIEEFLDEQSAYEPKQHAPPPEQRTQAEKEEDWSDIDDALFDKTALQRYILIAAQTSTGGLRDKPSAPADAYHTLYNLSGLSAAQHRTFFSPQMAEELRGKWVDNDGFNPALFNESIKETAAERQARRREIYVAGHAWTEDEGAHHYVGGEGNRMNAAHPLYNLTMTATRSMLDYFYGQTGA